MSELKSTFSREDIDTLIEAMGDWEMIGNQEFHMLSIIKDAPLPPEDHEAYEAWKQIKSHFRQREKDIKANRELKQEKAVFVKAKLMLVRRDLGINKLFDMAAEATDSVSTVDSVETDTTKAPVKIPITSSDTEKKLELAEYFIRDLGAKVWEFYQKFLNDRKEISR